MGPPRAESPKDKPRPVSPRQPTRVPENELHSESQCPRPKAQARGDKRTISELRKPAPEAMVHFTQRRSSGPTGREGVWTARCPAGRRTVVAVHVKPGRPLSSVAVGRGADVSLFSARSERGSPGPSSFHSLLLCPSRPRCWELSEEATGSPRSYRGHTCPPVSAASGTCGVRNPPPFPESETARCPYVVTLWPQVHGCHSPGLCSVTNRNVTITQGTGRSEQRKGLGRPQL